MPAIIIFSFQPRLKTGSALTCDELGISPPGNFKDKDTIAKWKAAKNEEIAREAAMQPYLGEFNSVMLYSPRHAAQPKPGAVFNYRKPEEKRPCVAACVLSWLREKFPDAWPHTTHPRYGPEGPPAIFVGFNPRTFIKMLGIESSLPANQLLDAGGQPTADVQSVAPLSLWFSNSDHRDIEKAVIPEGCKYVTMQTVIKAHQLDKDFPNWKGPHEDVNHDLELTMKLADRLGMLAES